MLRKNTASMAHVALALTLLISGCGGSKSSTPTTTSTTTSVAPGSSPQVYTPPVQPPSGGTSGGSGGGTTGLPAPLSFEINGRGNQPRHVCIPAKTKLHLRMIPQYNSAPLFPAYFPASTYAGTSPARYSDGSLVYDGSAASYGTLRVRMALGMTSAAWDYTAYAGTPSVVGNYTPYLAEYQPYIVDPAPDPTLSYPEYTDVTIYGSDARDRLCTYWEAQAGKCSHVSREVNQSLFATCPQDTVKIEISMILSDFPCGWDRPNWCKGYSTQIVPDYQQWRITVQAATENTSGF